MSRLTRKDINLSTMNKIDLEVILEGFAREHNIILEELDLSHFVEYEVKAMIVKSLNAARKWQESIKK